MQVTLVGFELFSEMNNIFCSARDRKRLIAEFNGGSCSGLLYVSGLQCLQCRLSYILAP